MASRAVGRGSHRRRRRPRLTRLRDWRVPTKVAAVLVIPALAFLVVVGWQASLLFGQAAALGDFADRAALATSVTALVHELQFERDLTTGHVAAAERTGSPWPEPVLTARRAVDEALDAYQRAAAPLRARHPDDPALARADAALAELTAVRAGADEGWLVRQAVFDGYSRAIEALLALLPAPLAGYDETVRGYLELTVVKEAGSRVRGQLYAVLSTGRFGPGEQVLVAEARAQRRVAEQRFRAGATPAQLAVFDEVVRGQAVHATARLEQAVLAQSSDGFDVTAQQWWSAATTELEQVREVETRLLADIQAAIRRGSGEASRQAAVVTTAALLVLLVSLVLSVAIGRSMVRSLRLLRRQAVDVARTDLPNLLTRLRAAHHTVPRIEVVPTTTGGRDEIAEVADAFTLVHRSAVDLAVEQAHMRRNVHRIVVNLARRSQLLVERQLELLDELERDESDPTQLANLFRLDHLATRMRRNNDSLLVLTDADPGRRYPDPVPLRSVALAAIAEIERYQQVRETVTTELRVVGHVVSDLVHLLAELLDNATTFSAKDAEVDLEVYQLPAGGAVIEITDRGMGMSAEALREANAILATPPAIDVATSERMGLVVVGHLAARHGLTVRLAHARWGVRATVRLPAWVLAPAVDGPPTVAVVGEHRTRPVVRRAEDVLRPDRTAGGTWWTRRSRRARAEDTPARSGPAVPQEAGAAPPAGDAAAHTGGPGGSAPARTTPVVTAPVTGPAGLPVRVPMAHLPATTIGTPPRPRDPEPDPEEVGVTLTAFYRGVRRAEAEEVTSAEQAGTGGGTPGRHTEPTGRSGQE